MTTTIDRPAPAATRGLFGTLTSTETPLEVVAAWRDRMEARIRTLEAQVREKDAALTVLRRMLAGGMGALPYRREAALALVDQALGVSADEAREEANSMAAHLNTRDYEDLHGATD